jgi:hypothetical protein
VASTTGSFPVQRIPKVCVFVCVGLNVCDLVTSTIRRPRPYWAVAPHNKIAFLALCYMNVIRSYIEGLRGQNKFANTVLHEFMTRNVCNEQVLNYSYVSLNTCSEREMV